MNKHIRFLLISFFIVVQAQAQHILTGTITDGQTHEPVIGATIYVAEMRSGAVSDVHGKYRIAALPTGNYTVQVSYVSYKTTLTRVQIQQNMEQNFLLESSAQALEEVVVSGVSSKTIIRESPVPMAAISQIRLLQQSSTNLIDAIARMPGMSQVSTGAGLSKPVIRGLGFNRVITMHDGIRQEDNQWGEEHSIQIDEYSIDRYEVIRGAGSLMYGSDGLGGVVSVLSPQPVADGVITGRVLSSYQSNHHLLGISAQVAGNKKGFVWLLQTSTKSAQNYRNPNDGRVYASNFSEPGNINGFVGVSRQWGYSKIYFLRSFQRFNIIQGSRDQTGRFTTATILPSGEVADRAVTDDELTSRAFIPYNSQQLINGKVAWNTLWSINPSSTVTANLSYARNRRSEYGDVLKPWQPQLDLYLHTGYYDFRYNFSPNAQYEISAGTNGMRQELDNQGSQVLYPNYTLFDNGIFLFGKRNFDRLKISGGIRYDIRTLNIGKLYADADGNFQVSPQGQDSERFAGMSRLYQNMSASLGGVYNINSQLAVRANLSRGFRAPTVPELSSNGVHAGTARYEIGKTDAVPEVAWQSDLGLTFENKSWYVEANIFQNSIQNYIYSERVQARNGQDSLFAGDIPVFRYNQGNARLQGLEATVTLNPETARWLSLTQSYSAVFGLNRSATREDAQYLPFMPAPRWMTQVKLTKNHWKSHTQNLYVSVDLEVHQSQNRFLAAFNTETYTSGYQLIHLNMGGDIITKQKRTLFSVYVSVHNLLDVAYQAHQSRLKYLDMNVVTGRPGVFNMGRNVSVKLVVPFSSKP